MTCSGGYIFHPVVSIYVDDVIRRSCPRGVYSVCSRTRAAYDIVTLPFYEF